MSSTNTDEIEFVPEVETIDPFEVIHHGECLSLSVGCEKNCTFASNNRLVPSTSRTGPRHSSDSQDVLPEEGYEHRACCVVACV